MYFFLLHCVSITETKIRSLVIRLWLFGCAASALETENKSLNLTAFIQLIEGIRK